MVAVAATDPQASVRHEDKKLLAYRKRHTVSIRWEQSTIYWTGVWDVFGFLAGAYVTHLEVWVRVVLTLHTVISSTTCLKITRHSVSATVDRSGTPWSWA